ncbi:unnamed protein product [Rotaria magnacalcarata]
MAENKNEDKWAKAVEELFCDGKLKSHQCKVYNKDRQSNNTDEKCGCQRLVRHHSFDGDELKVKPTNEDWTVEEHTEPLKALIYRSTTPAKFLRCSCENKKDIETLYKLMGSVCGKPKLIISVYGGHKYFTMDEAIEKEFMDSMAEAAITSGTWIITSGLNNGAAKLIGEGVDRLRALVNKKPSMTLLGMAWWGNIAEKARAMVLELQNEESRRENIPFRFDDKDTHSLETNHTHFLLLDDGKYRSEQEEFRKIINYPKEMQRSDFVTYACSLEQCYGVTILIEGGTNPCLAILNDIQCKRPVVFVQGSGKMADIIASLMDLTERNEYSPVSLTQNHEKKKSEDNNQLTQKQDLLELAIKWNCFDQASNLLEELQYMNEPELVVKLFKQALDDDRPRFIDFFLRINYDPRLTFYKKEAHRKPFIQNSSNYSQHDKMTATKWQAWIKYKYQVEMNKLGHDLIFQLYKDTFQSKYQNSASENESEYFPPKSNDHLDILYSKWTGNLMSTFFRKRSVADRMQLKFHTAVKYFLQYMCCWRVACCRSCSNRAKVTQEQFIEKIVVENPLSHINPDIEEKVNNGTLAEENTQTMLRDLLIWAAFTGHIDIAKILILHIRSRICAALLCVVILKYRARIANTSDTQHLYKQQAVDFEIYATDCINACNSKSENNACELMIRQIPLFGSTTCMQVPIACHCSRFINTDCFSQVLNRIWFNKLAPINLSAFSGVKMIASLMTFGLFAPLLITYSLSQDTDEIDDRNEDHGVSHSVVFYRLTFMCESESPSWMSWFFTLLLHSTPYILFYVGIVLWYWYGNVPNYLTTARIILAIDLEIWFLISLKFISAVKFLGPKIFMVKNMGKTPINTYGLSGIFKMIPSDSRFTERCTAFEHSATYDYARFVVEKKKITKKDADVS